MLVAQTTRTDGAGATSSAAVNPHHRGSAAAPDLIVLPPAGPVP
jgi:hypothetical protein